MYNLSLITENIKSYKGYISPDILPGFKTAGNRFLLAADDGKKTVGVCVFDAAPVTRIVEVNVTADCRKRQELYGAFLRMVIGICENLKAKAVTISLYDEDDFRGWEQVLDDHRFDLDKACVFYRFKLGSAMDNPRIQGLKAKTPAKLFDELRMHNLKEVETYLKEYGIYNSLDIDRIRIDLSSIYIGKDGVDGVLLVSDIPDGISVDFMYSVGDSPEIFAGLIKSTAEAVKKDKKLTKDSVGELACLTNESSRLFTKLFSEYEKIGEQLTYYTVLEY